MADQTLALEWAEDVLKRCDAISKFSDDPGVITRTFLSDATRSCHGYLTAWMEQLGMQIHLDGAGNLRALYPGKSPSAKRLLVGSHIDTVPNAGRYDGVLGVVLALKLIQLLKNKRFPFSIEIVAFSEEEGVRFGVPFIGSRALVGDLDATTLRETDHDGFTVQDALCHFGLDPLRVVEAQMSPDAAAYLEFHIEQGPVLESLGLPLGVVEAIAGQSRARITFVGKANHAGTTPMHLRQDALCAAAEWINHVEKRAFEVSGLVATVGKLDLIPNASNAVPGEVICSLDVRHASDSVRSAEFVQLLVSAKKIAHRRCLSVHGDLLLDQAAVPMNAELVMLCTKALEAVPTPARRMLSGAGHDAMILARRLPCGMIFLRSPGGISHHPDESVTLEDVATALRAGLCLLENLVQCTFLT